MPDEPTISPARRLRDAIEPLAAVGYHAPPALEAFEALGLDFLHGYVWGRASSLGEPAPAVVVSAFGVFQPELVERLYTEARALVGLEEIRAARLRGATDSLRGALGSPGDLAGLEETVVALEGAVADASTLGRPLFAGLTGHPQPPDLLGRLWHVTCSLREHRGDAHLGALVGAGIDGVQANVLNELWNDYALFAYTATRGWTQAQMQEGLRGLEERGWVADDSLTEGGRQLRETLEATTDVAEQGVLDSLGHDLDLHVERLGGWSQRLVEHAWFPDDDAKRSAG